MSFRSPKLLKAARDQACALCGAMGTTVPAHANSVALGKGIGYKAPDYFHAHLCQQCHDLCDGRQGRLSREEKEAMWIRAYLRTVARWFDQHIVIVK